MNGLRALEVIPRHSRISSLYEQAQARVVEEIMKKVVMEQSVKKSTEEELNILLKS